MPVASPAIERTLTRNSGWVQNSPSPVADRGTPGYQLHDGVIARYSFRDVEQRPQLTVLPLEIGCQLKLPVQGVPLQLQAGRPSGQPRRSLVHRVGGQKRSQHGVSHGPGETESLGRIEARESPRGDQQDGDDDEVTPLVLGSADGDVPQRLLRWLRRSGSAECRPECGRSLGPRR
jgi:hypothetical protein